jgi:hypothetical protein
VVRRLRGTRSRGSRGCEKLFTDSGMRRAEQVALVFVDDYAGVAVGAQPAPGTV